MFKHQGRSRTLKHNLQIAIVLSFVAGIVNVAGFLAIKVLITHVTGHFAFFIYDVANFNFWNGTIYLLYIVCFLLGSFTSSFLIERFKATKRLNIYVIPSMMEVMILTTVAIIGNFKIMHEAIIACCLLFAMGLQNAYVTKISNAVVRTTHLTGLFTDLGIELSQLFVTKSWSEKISLKATIKLRLYIISCFFLGGLFGGFLFAELELELNTLFVAAFILLISLFYDDLKFSLRKSKERVAAKSRKINFLKKT